MFVNRNLKDNLIKYSIEGYLGKFWVYSRIFNN